MLHRPNSVPRAQSYFLLTTCNVVPWLCYSTKCPLQDALAGYYEVLTLPGNHQVASVGVALRLRYQPMQIRRTLHADGTPD
jgi:hypothetical protein